MGPVNLGIKLYDGNYNSSHSCLCALYILPSTIHLVLQQLIIFCRKLTLLCTLNLYLVVILILNITTTLYQYLHGILCSFNLSMVVQEPPRMASCGTACLIDQVLMSNVLVAHDR